MDPILFLDQERATEGSNGRSSEEKIGHRNSTIYSF